MKPSFRNVSWGVLLLVLGQTWWSSGQAGDSQYKFHFDRSQMSANQVFRAGVPLLRDLPAGSVVASRITRVHVYPGGALIERTGQITLDPGERRLVIPALPDAMQAATLHISGFHAKAVAGSTFLEAGTLIEARPKELVDLESSLHQIEQQDRALASQQAAFQKRRELAVENVSRLSTATAPSVDGLRQALDYAQQEMLGVDDELANLDQARNELKPTLTQLRTAYEALRSKLERPVKHVVVEVTVKEKVELPLMIRYFVSGPTWKPRHVGRFEAESGQLTLETYAWVMQDTGETWQDVELRVSSAQPSEGLFPPSLPFLKVRLEESTGQIADQANRLREVAEQSSGAAAGAMRQFAPEGKLTIDSGPQGKRVLLETFGTNVQARRVAVPRVSSGVYLLLTLQNPQITPVLPGEASLFNGTDYVGTATLPQVLPGESVLLPFGRDESVMVERTPATRDIAGDNRRQTIRYRYQFRAANRLAHPVALEVRDEVPTSADHRVRVTLGNEEPKPTPGGKNDTPGLILWRMEVPAAGERRWQLNYTLEAPADRRIVGAD